MIRTSKIASSTLCLILLLTACNPVLINPGEEAQVAPRVGFLAPNFTLETIDGSSVTLSSLRGKSVFINFWDVACYYCRFEMPNIQLMHETYSDKGLVVLSINIKDDKSDVAAYKDRMKLTFLILLDSDGKVSRTYLVQGKPHSYFVDKDGVVQDVYIGELSREEMEKRVQLVLAK